MQHFSGGLWKIGWKHWYNKWHYTMMLQFTWKEKLNALNLYLDDAFSKLSAYSLYLQGSNGSDVFAIHETTGAFMKKVMSWKSCIQQDKYDCFETLETFIIENQAWPNINVLSTISTHLPLLKITLTLHGRKIDTMNLVTYFKTMYQIKCQKN